MTCQHNAFDGGSFDVTSETTLEIDGRRIGADQPAWVIAEIGVNHDGSVERAQELIAHAAASGCDAVKLQCFQADQLVTSGAPLSAYQQAGADGDDQRTMLSRLQLPSDAIASLDETARDHGLTLVASPFDLESLEQLIDRGISAIKIPSGELTDVPVLRRAARSGIPLLVSTGMANWTEIDGAVAELRDHGTTAIYMHCVSAYPTPTEHANVRAVAELAERTGALVGYSDHCLDDEPSLAARVLGACVIERHLTHDRAAPGPDHDVSLDPPAFRRWVASLRRLESSLGTGVRGHDALEDEARQNARKSIVACRDLRAGERLDESMITTRRPNTGVGAEEWDAVVGRTLTADVSEGQPLRRENL